jgi:hypothetical protein
VPRALPESPNHYGSLVSVNVVEIIAAESMAAGDAIRVSSPAVRAPLKLAANPLVPSPEDRDPKTPFRYQSSRS